MLDKKYLLDTAILIPARLESERYPNKMLVDIGGKSLIKHVYDKCKETGIDTYVITDSEEIAKEVEYSIITGKADNGTERCCKTMKGFYDLNMILYDYFINVQGDMIDITENMIRSAHSKLDKYLVSTIFTDMPGDKLQDKNTVKMISNGDEAHWFCRASLEYGYHHLGVYGYTKEAANLYIDSVQYSAEKKEKLEQLRWIQNGVRIGAEYVPDNCIEINTPEDLAEWKVLHK